MSHENLNTIIASLGLLIAVVTAWHQFGPAPDELEIEVTGRVDHGVPLTKGTPFPGLDKKGKQHLVGPVFWQLVIYNNLDRAVSVLAIETFMSGPTGGLIDYSDMDAGIFESSSYPVPLALPLTIEPRHATAITVGLNIPVAAEETTDSPCFKSGASTRDVEVCLFSRGRDLFGNAVNYSEYPNPGGKPLVHASWHDGYESPAFFAILRTGDGSEFTAPIKYYPAP